MASSVKSLYKTALELHKNARLAEAEYQYKQVLAADARHSDSLHMLGILHHQKKDYQKAVEFYHQAIEVNPSAGHFYFNLGRTHLAVKHLQPAIEAFSKSIQINPDFGEAYFNLGKAFKQASEFNQAEKCFEETLRLLPKHVAALNNLGNVRQQLGNTSEARICFERALKIEPSLAEAHFNLGNLFQIEGDLAKAIESYSKTLSLKPTFFRAHYELANTFQKLADPMQAESHFRHALNIAPRFADGAFALSNLLRQSGRTEEAIKFLRMTVKLMPDNALALNNLGAALHSLGVFEEAVACLQKALTLDANCAEAYFNLGNLFESRNRFEEAVAHYRKALSFEPHFATQIFYHLCFTQIKMCDWSNYDQNVQELIERTEEYIAVKEQRFGLPPLTLNAFPIPNELRAKVVQQQARALSRALATTRTACNFSYPAASGRVLKLAYVSPDFRQHAVGTLIRGMFGHHDRTKFKIYAYSLVSANDQITEQVKNECDVFKDISLLSPEQAAREINAGRNSNPRRSGRSYNVFQAGDIRSQTRRPCNCTGSVTWIQWVRNTCPTSLRDETVIDKTQPHAFTETIITLPDSFIAATPIEIEKGLPDRSLFNLPADKFIFGCMNSSHKIDPHVFAIWMSILHKVPNSILCLYDSDSESVRSNITAQAGAHGIDVDRILFCPKLPMLDYLKRYRCIDLFLDTFLYNAGATAIHALWMGLPILTKPGSTFMSRMCASFLQTLGMQKMICPDDETYTSVAVKFATDIKFRDGIKHTLDTKTSTKALFDIPGFVKHLERALLHTWENLQRQS